MWFLSVRDYGNPPVVVIPNDAACFIGRENPFSSFRRTPPASPGAKTLSRHSEGRRLLHRARKPFLVIPNDAACFIGRENPFSSFRGDLQLHRRSNPESSFCR
ncbi:MAG: hypothetical protein ACREPK_07910 [Rhodanobacteraceae bacterium]